MKGEKMDETFIRELYESRFISHDIMCKLLDVVVEKEEKDMFEDRETYEALLKENKYLREENDKLTDKLSHFIVWDFGDFQFTTYGCTSKVSFMLYDNNTVELMNAALINTTNNLKTYDVNIPKFIFSFKNIETAEAWYNVLLHGIDPCVINGRIDLEREYKTICIMDDVLADKTRRSNENN